MDSSDDEKSKGSDIDSPQSAHNQGSHSFSIREEDRPGRVLLRPWLENMLESNTIEGLQWLDKEKTMFKVPWKHRSKKDWSTRHSSVFLEWAKNTGRWNKGDPTPNYAQLKTRLRCAFNKAPDIEEMKGYHSAQGEEPYKVYRFKNKKECLANKLSQGGKNLSKRFFGSSGRSNHQAGPFEIKKERYEDETAATGDSDGFYPEGAQETQILSFKDQTGEVKDELKIEQGDINCVPLEERETKFTPGVIPLTVEMFSSSVSDESDTENEGSKRSRSHRGRHGSARGQKHQELPVEPQNGHLVPLKQQFHQKQTDFDISPNATNGIIPANVTMTNGVSGDMKESSSEERGNLDFLTVASLFMEAEKILQNKKDPIAGRESEAKQCIKQEIPEHVTSEGEANHCSKENSKENTANEPEKEKQSAGLVRYLDSTLNGNPKPISPAVSAATSHSYPPKLPKLVPLSSLRSFPMLNADSKGNAGSTLLSQLSKIRMVNGNLLHQSMKPQVRLNPSPGTPSLSLGGQAMGSHRPDSATHFHPRLLIFSSSSFLQNFSAPTMAIPRPANPENVRIVLGKFQSPSTASPSVAKDSGFGSQSMPSLIMLSSAAEAAESASSQKVQAIPPATQATSPLNGTLSKDETNILDVRNEPSVRSDEIQTIASVITTSVTTTCVTPMVSAVAKATPMKETSMDSGAQEEALDLSSATLKQREPADPTMTDDISDKLEIDEVPVPVCSTAKEDVGCKQNASDDGAVDVAARLNEATTTLREAEELAADNDPKSLKLLKGVIESLRMCSVELNQFQKSLNSEKDVLHWRTKLLESEEEKIQLKVHYFGMSQKKDDQTVGDPKSFEFLTNDSGAAANKDASKPYLEVAKQFQAPGIAPITSIPASNDRVLDLVKVQNPLIVNRQSAPLGSLSQKVVGVSNFSAGPIKVTVAPSMSQVLPQTLSNAAKSPKPIRVINLSKPPEPCGVVYPMQQDRGKAHHPRPSTPALSLVNGVRLSSTLKNAGPQLDSVGVSPSLSPSSSPLVLNIQSPFSNLKVVKINRTPSTDGNSMSATAWCSPTLLSSSAKLKSSEINELKSTDEGHQSRDSNFQEANQKSRLDETSPDVESSAKRFKLSLDETRGSHSINLSINDQTTAEYDQFKKKWHL